MCLYWESATPGCLNAAWLAAWAYAGIGLHTLQMQALMVVCAAGCPHCLAAL